ncbi:hypothetical protein CH35J_008947 [Colletotrichum higginsianum]|uniref:Rhodopsin domain-containing protein n=1 Tax=Colletotrichum higginsianum TaxID=80884 RepID=A0A4T0VV71_9PEZI|nr:hypothetical protein CH35J_008947 [Colletotrichum higginsianum]
MSNDTSPVGAFPAPPGVIPNFENPRDAGWTLNVASMSVMAAVTTLFIGIRTYVKFSLTTPLLPEDYTCVLSYALIMLYIATVFVMAHYGEGYHAWELTKESYQEVMRWLYASSIVYIPAAYFTKVTLLLFEARVFEVHERTSRGIRIFIVILLICYIPLQTIKVIICLPISAFWDPKTPNPTCLNQRKVFIADLSLAIITDFAILALPIPLLWGLRMPLRKKLKILTLLGAGGIATAVTVFRMYLVVQFLGSTDVTADFVVLDIVTALEIVIGVVCACLPSTNILYERIRRNEPKPTGNLPRTAHKARPKPTHSSYMWSIMTTKKQTRSARTEAAMSEREPSPNYRTNFDTELAILTGQPMGTTAPKEELEVQSEPNNNDNNNDNNENNDNNDTHDDRVYNPRANSIDGRREGWLAPGTEGSSGRRSGRGGTPNWQRHEIEARKSWEAAWEVTVPRGRLPSIPEDGGPPRLELRTHSSSDWGSLKHV